MNENTLSKLAKILNQAENASTQAEADAFFAKAQELSTSTGIELEIARAHAQAGFRRPQLTQEAVKVAEYRTKYRTTLVDLMLRVAENNGLKAAISQSRTTVYLYGYDTDIEVAKLLYASLATQMKMASDAYIRSGEYKKETVRVPARETYNRRTGEWTYTESGYKPVHGTTARLNFQDAFSSTIGGRLAKARREAERKAALEQEHIHDLNTPEAEPAAAPLSDSVAMVLVRKAEAVDDYYYKETGFKREGSRGAYTGTQASRHSGSARAAGRSAGQSASLGGGRAIGGARKSVSS
jgi:hypothetical protein